MKTADRVRMVVSTNLAVDFQGVWGGRGDVEGT
jgi:hypothetical protein